MSQTNIESELADGGILVAYRFACPCCHENLIDPRVVKLVFDIEKRIGARLTVTSGYRCENNNRKVGGSPTSSHMKGLAVDVACETSPLRFRIINAAIMEGIDRIGVYRHFIHLDIDRRKGHRVIWMG